MIHRLSLLWGEPVEQLEEELSAEDIIRYQCLYELEPWGSEADDVRFQQLCYVTAQVNSTKKLNASDFVMPWRRTKKEKVPFEVGLMSHVENMRRQTPK